MVAQAIKNSNVRNGDWQSTAEIIDFDIDFLFLVLENLQKFTAQTKVLFINQYGLFLKYHQDKFMKIFTAQASENNQNSLNSRLKEFYYQIT